jgi:VanZ family protein
VSPIDRSRRWAAWGLAAYGLLVAVVAFTPVSYAGIVHALARLVNRIPGLDFFGSGWIEFSANILLFVPIGFLLALVLRRPVIGALIGVAISVGIELIQLVIPDRQSSVRDVISNGSGAAIGALIAWLVLRRLRRALDAGRDRPAEGPPL